VIRISSGRSTFTSTPTLTPDDELLDEELDDELDELLELEELVELDDELLELDDELPPWEPPQAVRAAIQMIGHRPENRLIQIPS